ncbi:MAG: RimK family alpha-L-glutamate ligase [Hormoscilla sp.]
MKIVILGAKFRESDEQLYKAACDRNHVVTYIHPNNISFSVVGNEIDLGYLSTVDRVLIRRTVEQSRKISTIATALKALQIPCIERPYHYTSSSASKIGAILHRATKVKVPSSWAIWDMDQLDDLLSKNLDLPVLFKPDLGHGGKGIERLSSVAEIKEFAKSYFEKQTELPFLVQKEVQRKREYRVLMLNGKPIGTVLKCASKDSIVANAEAGNSFVDAREAPENIPLEEILSVEDCAVKATNLDKLIFAGVDVLVSENDESYILECNRNPQFLETQRALPNVDIASKVIECLENPSEWI